MLELIAQFFSWLETAVETMMLRERMSDWWNMIISKIQDPILGVVLQYKVLSCEIISNHNIPLFENHICL